VAAAKVAFHPGASEDYAAAFSWYYSRGPALASDFEREIDRAIRLISQNPQRWSRFHNDRRRLLVRNFLMRSSMKCMAERL
jgi:plasmid stabilization system protein ParE